MLDRACAAKVVIYGHVSKTKVKPFQYGRTHYEVRLKSVVNRFPAHRVHHSETIIAVVAFSLRSLSKDRHTNKGGYRNNKKGGYRPREKFLSIQSWFIYNFHIFNTLW